MCKNNWYKFTFFQRLQVQFCSRAILQKNGTATPSVAASLIEHLPDEDDPERPMEERIAKNVAFVAYVGM